MIELVEGLNEFTIPLVASITPEDLPPGFEIDYINAEPSVVILGNEMKFHIWWFCPNPGLEMRTFNLHCKINGITLQQSWGPTTRGNGAIDFFYTPQSVGMYTATVLNKSVSFEVKEEVVGAFYNPYGGIEVYETLDALAAAIVSDGDWKKDCIEYNCHHATYTGRCPYCSASFESRVANTREYEAPGDVHNAKLEVAYILIEHIENSHPDHPLTEPRE